MREAAGRPVDRATVAENRSGARSEPCCGSGSGVCLAASRWGERPGRWLAGNRV